MTETYTLNAERRGRVGKGGAREARRAGRIPGIVYGSGKDPAPIAVDGNQLLNRLQQGGFFSHVYDMQIDGVSERVLPREVQHDPVTGRPVHVDFLRVSATTKTTVDVAIAFDHPEQSPGLKRGGVLNVVMHSVQLYCRPDAIPERLSVDLSGLEIGDVIHADALKLPAGVELAAVDVDATVASIAPPMTEQEPAEAATEEAAPAS